MGFIGSNFIRYELSHRDAVSVVNLDRLSYGSNPENLKDVNAGGRYRFLRGDINDFELIKKMTYDIDAIVNFAAESHVDRSIANPRSFEETNTTGVVNLLEACRLRDLTFLQVSTDEVYGSSQETQAFTEEDPLGPSSPYSASKGAADLFVGAYRTTYKLRTFVTRSTNNYGQYQFPEKFMPKAIIRALLGLHVPVYGSGRQVRDWVHVQDHCKALDLVLRKGKPGETYNIAAGRQVENLKVVESILSILRKPKSLIANVEDRPGHDFRYRLDASKIERELGWKRERSFQDALRETVEWYVNNEWWWRPLITDKILSATPWKEKW
jgi:dTDP-glucose 4,6-dehydratase